MRKILASLGLAVMAFPVGLHGEEAPRYRGFIIDDSRVRTMTSLEAIRTATKEQIDIVFAVGVPAEMLKFFQSVPFEVVPPGVIAPGNPGLYWPKIKTIRVTAVVVVAGHKPILLHELLHAYHDQMIPGGFDNSDIARFFERAKTIPAYEAHSHMMLNDREYFACAGTAYLFGVTAQEPFQREKVRINQPAFYDYLKNLFGPTAGEYHGSLTVPN
jgi:hypothetical protein